MQEQSSIILKIKSIYYSFTNAERKVADYVLKNSQKVIYLPITELSKRCNTGETTIVRFCRHIGLSGFQELKLNLAKEIVEPETSIHENISFDDTTTMQIQKVTAQNVQTIANTAKLLSAGQIEQAVDAIINARKIHFYGVGPSGYTALEAQYKFMRLGLNVNANLDSHIQAISTVSLKEGDVVVGISFSGSTKDTVATCQLAKKSSAKVICITNYARSPITTVADIILLTSAKETPLQGGALTSKIAQLHVLDILYTAVAIRLKDDAVRTLDKTANAVLDKLY